MRRWIRVGLAATAATAGMVALTPAAHAAAGTAFSAGRASDTGASDTNSFAALPPELLKCIAAQVDHFDQVSFSKVCKRWRTIAHEHPLFVQNIKVVRTHLQLTDALAKAQVSPVEILIVPAEDLDIVNAPVNPQAHITIHDTRSLRQSVVKVRADIQVTATGTADVRAYKRSQVTASGTATVTAYESAQVTASGFATVWAFSSVKVTASGKVMVWAFDSTQITADDATMVHASNAAAVAVYSADCEVLVRDSSVRLWIDNQTRGAVRPSPGVTPISTIVADVRKIRWEDMA